MANSSFEPPVVWEFCRLFVPDFGGSCVTPGIYPDNISSLALIFRSPREGGVYGRSPGLNAPRGWGVQRKDESGVRKRTWWLRGCEGRYLKVCPEGGLE